jgi:hypothetical protein
MRGVLPGNFSAPVLPVFLVAIQSAKNENRLFPDSYPFIGCAEAAGKCPEISTVFALKHAHLPPILHIGTKSDDAHGSRSDSGYLTVVNSRESERDGSNENARGENHSICDFREFMSFFQRHKLSSLSVNQPISWLCFEGYPGQEYHFEVISCPRVERHTSC